MIENENIVTFNLNKLLLILKDKILMILLIFLTSGSLAYFLSFSFENYYRSKSVIASSSIDINGMSTSSQGQSGLGGLFQSFTSISPGGGSIRIIKEIALSRDFILLFIKEHDLEATLIASNDDGDRSNGKIEFNDLIYSKLENKFISTDYSDQLKIDQASYEIFLELINIDEEPIYPILTLSFDFKDSVYGTKILNQYIVFLEKTLKERVITKAEMIEKQFIDLLSRKNFYDLNESITQEILKQITLKLYGNSEITSQFFILEESHSIDKRVRPNRPLFVALFSGFVTLLSIMIILFLYKEKSEEKSV